MSKLAKTLLSTSLIGKVTIIMNLSTQDQQNWNHSFITPLAQVMHFTRLKLI